MQIKNTEYWDFIPTAVSSTLYDQVKSDLILPNPKCTQDSAKWWNSKYEILKYEILNTNKFNSSRKYANFCDWKRKALMFAISSYSSCTSCRLLKRVSDQQKDWKGLVLKELIENVALFLTVSQTEPSLVQRVGKNPSMAILGTEFPYMFKRNRYYFRSVSLSPKKNHFLFKVVFPLALRIFFLMVQWVSCERERSWLESKNIYSLLKPVRAQERCVPSCHIWLWISQRSLHLNWFISVKKNNLKSLNVNKLYNSFLKLMFANNQTRRC